MMGFMTLILCGSFLADAPAEAVTKPSFRQTGGIPTVEITAERAAPLVVPRGVDAIQYFTVTNRRSKPIEPSLAPGLGLYPHRSHKTIAAGDSAEYAVIFKTLRHGGETDRRLALLVEDKDAWVDWHFYVRRDVVCQPSRFSLGEVQSKSEARSVCTLQAIVGPDWKITSAESKRGNVTVTATETLRKPAEKGLVRVDFEITAKLDEKASPGPVDDVVVLHTTDKEMPEIWILCDGTVVVPKGE